MDPIYLLSVITLLSNIFLVYFVVSYILKRFFKKDILWRGIEESLAKKSKYYAFIIALTATLGSLYLSEIRGFAPCILCWYQRILMYPISIILATSLIKKAKDVHLYVLPLSFFGAVLALYHYNLQINPNQYAPCETIGFSVSCTDRFFTYFGYITIPWMSFSAFVLISLFMLLERSKVSKR